ncbi:unnamed protein product [Nippostrongylus brasiliensis]|uniref:CRAL-TRIO domain-containing protein n=1 Tax=Nippostrongylus brasiliensis TaxID=27835 RepID=A0A0N4XSX0_NIPBR|nr:unnamed protein product [Nippostrongylus brasiliensis]
MTISTEISPEDREKIAELRKLVRDDLTEYYDTDFNLLRWLQGHTHLDVPHIARKLRHHLKARKSTWDLDNMHKKTRTHPIHNHWRYGITGHSGVLENVIVNIEQCGRTDYSGMMECFSISEVMKARVYDLEEMLAQCMELEKATGKQAWILYVMDVTGLEYNKKLYDLITGSMKSLAEFMAEHYVELIKFFVPVSIPSFAVALWTVVRPLLPERTKHKVQILSSSNWKDEMLRFSKADALPSIWNDEIHSFPAHVDRPQPFPKDWYHSNKGIEVPEDVKEIDVHAGKYHSITLHLNQGDVISWWISGSRNFGFGIYLATDEDDNDYAV